MICNADSFINAAASGLENWRFWSFGPSPRVVDPEVELFTHVMEADGKAKYIDEGFAAQAVGDMLSIAKFGNELGASNLTTSGFAEKIKSFKGPALLGAGALECEKPYQPKYPALCGTGGTGFALVHGKWTSLGAIQIKPQ